MDRNETRTATGGSRDFYFDTVSALMRRDVVGPNDDILVTCGGMVDRNTLVRAQLRNVTISNVDTRTAAAAYSPYQWSDQNAEDLRFADESFDFVIAHSGLHHCRSPHRALLEMYRVARKGVLVFEPRDGWLMRLGVRLGFGQEYEVAAVLANRSSAGGVGNTALPNYVYRWTPREIEKTINSNAPEVRHRFEYYYALRLPLGALALRKKKVQLCIAKILGTFSHFAAIFPPVANNIGFLIMKPRLPQDLQSWLRVNKDGIEFQSSASVAPKAECRQLRAL